MPMCRGRYSWAITIVIPNVPITADADDGERDRAGNAADEHEDEHQRDDRDVGAEQDGAQPDAVGERPGGSVPTPPTSSITESSVVAVRLRVAERHLPERARR